MKKTPKLFYGEVRKTVNMAPAGTSRLVVATERSGDNMKATDKPDAVKDGKLMRSTARELSLEFRRQIFAKANAFDVPTIKYKQQYLLEEVIADMESFV